MDVSGALSHARIRGDDIAAGRYDGARATLSLVDWCAPEAGAVSLAHGEIGEVTCRDDSFEAELRTAQALMDRTPVELCTPECRARLGDARCRVDLAPLTHAARIEEIVSETIIAVGVGASAGAFAYGRLRPLHGDLAGMDFEIVASADGHVTLRDGIGGGLMVGGLVELREGCDRRFATCRDRFGNKDNFRGEPHVPGTDSIMRYPSL